MPDSDDGGTGSKDLTIEEGLEIVEEEGQFKVQRKDEGCFIATAAYGTPTAIEINRLRKFRDDWLVDNRIGQALLLTYYGRDGLHAAKSGQFISAHPLLATLVRIGFLNPLVKFLSYYQEGFAPPEYEESEDWIRFKNKHIDTSQWEEINERLERR